MATFKITLVKATPWRGEAEELWSNSYHFSGTTPADATAWSALAQAIWALEGGMMYDSPVRTHLVHGYGYNPGSDTADWSGDYTAGGSGAGIPAAGGLLAGTTGIANPLQVCILWRFQCGLSVHTGKPRYIMKYIHDVDSGPFGPDSAPGLTVPGLTAFAKFWNGSLDGDAVLCAPDGTVATSGILKTYLTTHQIKRRGKRPRRGA